MKRTEALALFTAECLQVHETLDSLKVPRESQGERLSMTQRVEELARAYTALMLTKTTLNRCAG